MKQKETLSNTPHHNGNGHINGHNIEAIIEEVGDEHIGTSLDTPMRAGAFEKTDEEKINLISEHFEQIMDILGLDLTDDSLSGTPQRVAKMYVKEIFGGLDPKNRPDVKLFENKYKYGEMLVEKDINFYTNCEHHFVPIFGRAHVAYISNGKVAGLSKLNRIVRYYAKRPQVQERFTQQIIDDLKKALHTEDVAVIIDAKHLCVSMRGVEDITSSTVTASYSGEFKKTEVKQELFKYLEMNAEG